MSAVIIAMVFSLGCGSQCERSATQHCATIPAEDKKRIWAVDDPMQACVDERAAACELDRKIRQEEGKDFRVPNASN